MGLVDGFTKRNPSVGPGHDSTLDHRNGRRIMLGDILERRGHEPGCCGNAARDLRGRHDIGLFPAVHDVPWLSQQRAQRGAVETQMRMPAEPDIERHDRAGFSGKRLELDVAEVAWKPRGRRDGHVPSSGALERHLVREASVLRDHVGVPNREQPFQSILRA